MTSDGPQLCPTRNTPLPATAQFFVNYGTPMPTEPGVRAHTMPTGTIEVSRIAQAMHDVVPSTPNDPYVRLQQVRIELTLDQNDKALDDIDKLLKTRSYVTPGYLKVDPMFKPLRGNPRFEKMLALPMGTSTN